MERLNSLSGTLNKKQLLFGINQGCTFDSLRIENMQKIAAMNLDGYAIGGLAVGEPKEDMYRVISAVEPYMPKDKPRYLMGVGTPGNILEGVSRGVDLFDCVMPSRNARHGHLLPDGIINLNNARYGLTGIHRRFLRLPDLPQAYQSLSTICLKRKCSRCVYA